jgi:hypothetical protein
MVRRWLLRSARGNQNQIYFETCRTSDEYNGYFQRFSLNSDSHETVNRMAWSSHHLSNSAQNSQKIPMGAICDVFGAPTEKLLISN